MKILAIGDIHGRTIWKEIVKKENPDKIVFAGDYFDSRDDISGGEQIANFKEIVSFKEQNRDKVILLFGNHDLHYIIDEHYSGFQHNYQIDISEVLQNALRKDFLQICFRIDSFLFSHAGFTKTWCKNILADEVLEGNSWVKYVNEMLINQPNAFKFTFGMNLDFSGDDITQPPTWVRPVSLLKDKLAGYIQIVGHTSHPKLLIIEDVAFIDTLGTSGEYLIVENGELIARG